MLMPRHDAARLFALLPMLMISIFHAARHFRRRQPPSDAAMPLLIFRQDATRRLMPIRLML